MKLKLISIVCVLTVSACGLVNNISNKEMIMHYEAGMKYESQKDYESASDQFYKALVAAKSGNEKPEVISMLMYEYGRNTGYACHLSQSESYLKDSLAMESGLPVRNKRNIAIRNFELARLMYDQNRYAESSKYYEAALNELGSDVDTYPITFSGVYKEYADALTKSGNSSQAKVALKKAEELSHKPPEKNPEYSFTRYKCEHVL